MKKIDTNIMGWKFPKECTRSRLYTIWNSMKQRCYTKSCTSYKRYGARGISVCDMWRNNYMEFYKWAIDNGYSDNLTIDRIDSNGNYEPSNCRWATPKIQNNNLRTNIVLTYNGITKTLREWSDITGIKLMTLHSRVNMGWETEKILTKPVEKHNRNYGTR